jgi:hypothetical protein
MIWLLRPDHPKATEFAPITFSRINIVNYSYLYAFVQLGYSAASFPHLIEMSALFSTWYDPTTWTYLRLLLKAGKDAFEVYRYIPRRDHYDLRRWLVTCWQRQLRGLGKPVFQHQGSLRWLGRMPLAHYHTDSGLGGGSVLYRLRRWSSGPAGRALNVPFAVV